MNKLIAGFVLCMLLLGGTRGVAQTSGHAQVTLTVTGFRPMTSLTNPEYVDTLTTLAPHDAVTLSSPKGMPTLRVKRAVGIELTLVSADGKESYRPLAVYFRQLTSDSTATLDPKGLINFTQSITANGTIVIQNSFTLTGADGKYEFFVLIQRVSDGAIGLIDPEIENEIVP